MSIKIVFIEIEEDTICPTEINSLEQIAPIINNEKNINIIHANIRSLNKNLKKSKKLHSHIG